MQNYGYRYWMLNLWRGKLHEQQDFRTKAGAIRAAKRAAEYTHASNEEFGTPEEERSELFIVVDRETGEVIGGRMIVDADRKPAPVDRDKLRKDLSDIEAREGIQVWYDLLNPTYGTSAGECENYFEYDLTRGDKDGESEDRLREIRKRVDFFKPTV